MISPNNALLVALAQPCVGAFIGYLTNKIAIRMLFRPLRPWYVLGWRVPLTPGIIPSKRHELAVSIGEMVGMRLLTSEEICRAISGESFQEHLHSLVVRRLNAFCQKELASLHGYFSGKGNSALFTLQNRLIRELQDAINSFFASSNAAEQLTLWLQAADESPRAEQDKAATLLCLAENLFKQMLEQVGQRLGVLLAVMLQQAGAEGKSLRDLMPDAFAQQLHALVETQSPVILERITQQVLAKETRPTLLQGLVSIVHQLLESLGPVGAMARGFFEADTFIRKINEYLDANSSSIAAWLNSPEAKKRLAAVLGESADTLLNRSIAELLAGLEPGQLDELCAAIGEQIVRAFQSETAIKELAPVLTDSLRQSLTGSPGRDAGHTTLILTFLRSGEGRAFVQMAVKSLVQQLFFQPLGKLEQRIPQALQEVMVAHLVKHVNHLLLYELSGLVPALNIKELVSSKVDSLELLQLERLLLGIMEEQFKYINLFGGLLGFLIGLINLFLFKLL
ncbi:MAG: DUF445 family protein [Desulfobulbaceae bacterium]|nr:DUF445 family protein [Desulfobulbaceae bacterium]